MKLGISSWCQPSTVCDSNQALLARSARTTARVSQSQRRRAGIVTGLLLIGNRNLAEDYGFACGWLWSCGSTAKAAALRSSGEKKPPPSKRGYGGGWGVGLSISARASVQRSQIVG